MTAIALLVLVVIVKNAIINSRVISGSSYKLEIELCEYMLDSRDDFSDEDTFTMDEVKKILAGLKSFDGLDTEKFVAESKERRHIESKND